MLGIECLQLLSLIGWTTGTHTSRMWNSSRRLRFRCDQDLPADTRNPAHLLAVPSASCLDLVLCSENMGERRDLILYQSHNYSHTHFPHPSVTGSEDTCISNIYHIVNEKNVLFFWIKYIMIRNLQQYCMNILMHWCFYSRPHLSVSIALFLVGHAGSVYAQLLSRTENVACNEYSHR